MSDNQGASCGPGSRASTEPQERLGPSGFDPSRDRLQVLRDMQEAGSALFQQAIPEGHRCGPITVSQERWDAIEAVQAGEDAALAALMPTEQDAIRLMHDAYTRLKKLGWNDAIYCPKDGSEFDAIEIGSTGIHRAHYTGEWPDGHWWVADGGDIYPSRPALYRVSHRLISFTEQLDRVRGAERERCARLAQKVAEESRLVDGHEHSRVRHEGIVAGASFCATAIRGSYE